MRILQCNSFHYLRGGAERCFLDLSDLLRAHGHEVAPFCMAHEKNWPTPYADYFFSSIDFPSMLQDNGLTGKLKVAERVIYSREARRNIERLIKDFQPDIAHVHGIAHETSPSILPALKAAGIPIVQTLHDYKLLCPNTNFANQDGICEACKGHHYYNVVRHRCKRGSLGASVLASLEMYTHKWLKIYESNVDLFITPSRFLKEKALEYGVKNPIVQLPNFIKIDQIQPRSTPENYFVYSGRLVAVKGVRTLLAAMRAVPQSHLYIAGSGELEPELKDYVRQHNLTNVTFLGHLGTDALMTLMQNAQFIVTPSEWYENYPMAVLEAQACATPVLGANIGGIPEIVIDGETGLLFETGNVDHLTTQIHYLLEHRDEAIRMGQAGRERVAHYNHPDYHYAKTMEVYQQLIKNPLGTL